MATSQDLGVTPDFETEVTQRPIKFHNWLGDSSASSKVGARTPEGISLALYRHASQLASTYLAE
jgi:hypothetical protein